VGELAIQDNLSSGVIADLFVSQQRDQALLERSKAAFDFSFGLTSSPDEPGLRVKGERWRGLVGLQGLTAVARRTEASAPICLIARSGLWGRRS